MPVKVTRLLTITTGPAFYRGEPKANMLLCRVPRRDKINLEKIKASLFTLCTECGYKIPPAETRRIDFDHMRCPKCDAAFIPGKTK